MFDAIKIINEVLPQVVHHWNMALGRQLQFMPNTTYIDPQSTPIAKSIRTVCAVANGEIAHDGEAMEATQSICETLFSTPLSNSYDIPPHFWKSDLGQAILQCRLVASGDVLITKSEAAQILRGSSSDVDLNWLNRLIDREGLTVYSDPTDPNPQHATRLSRAEVESLINA